MCPDVDVVRDSRGIPLFIHESEFIGRVGDDGIDTAVLQVRQFI